MTRFRCHALITAHSSHPGETYIANCNLLIEILEDVNRRYIFSCMFQAMSVDHKHARTNNLHPKRHPFILLFVASTTMRLFSSVAPRRHVFSTPRSFASWRLFNKSNAWKLRMVHVSWQTSSICVGSGYQENDTSVNTNSHKSMFCFKIGFNGTMSNLSSTYFPRYIGLS